MNRSDTCSRGSREKRHILRTPPSVTPTQHHPFCGNTRVSAREHSSLPFKHSHTFKWRRGKWGEWLPAVTDHALTIRFWYRHHTRANNNFTFGVLLYCAFILAVTDWRLIDYWVDCECNRVVWALPLPSAVLECLYIKIKKMCLVLCSCLKKKKEERIKKKNDDNNWQTKQAG